MSPRRVVITGLGIVSPLGNDLATTWDGIVNGRSGIGPITHFDTEGYVTKISGEVRGFDVTLHTEDAAEARRWFDELSDGDDVFGNIVDAPTVARAYGTGMQSRMGALAKRC